MLHQLGIRPLGTLATGRPELRYSGIFIVE